MSTGMEYMVDQGEGALVGVIEPVTTRGDDAQVDTPCFAYNRMRERWNPILDLLSGTQGMRALGEKWLPKMPRETPAQYRFRLANSFLETLYEDTIDKLVHKPFSRRVHYSEEGLSERMLALTRNMDLAGTTLDDFCKAWFRDGLIYGFGHALVDFTFVPENASGQILTVGEERLRGARPTIVRVPPTALFAWQEELGADGIRRLTEIRIREVRYERDGRWGQTKVHYIRVWTPETVQLWKKGVDDEDFVEASDPIPHTFGRIPLVTWYANRQDFMVAKPPFEGLAWCNLDHWQSYSDQRNILHVARVPMLFRTGVPDEARKTGAETVVGSGREITTSNVQADAKYVEVTGSSIEQGENHLESRRERAKELGSQPKSTRAPGTTATGVVAEDSTGAASVQDQIGSEELAVLECFELAASHAGESLPEDWKVSIFKDFELGGRSAVDHAELRADYDRGLITEETYLTERKARGLYRPAMDIDRELASAKVNGEIVPRDQVVPMSGADQNRGPDPTNENPLAQRAGSVGGGTD